MEEYSIMTVLWSTVLPIIMAIAKKALAGFLIVTAMFITLRVADARSKIKFESVWDEMSATDKGKYLTNRMWVYGAIFCLTFVFV